MPDDIRPDAYEALHSQQLLAQETQNHISAGKILGILKGFIEIGSLLDVGCGIGTWIKTAMELGVPDARGVEGPWLNPQNVVVAPNLVQVTDLEKPLALGRRFDLVLCMEVAEHLPQRAAETLVASLTQHADHVLFSAAIPYQGGTHHVNEQFLSYWVDLFTQRNYVLVDLIRGRIWDDPDILWWLRQNTVLFVERAALQRNPALFAQRQVLHPANIIHPDVYLMRTTALYQEIDRAKQFVDILINYNKPVIVSRLPDGRIGVTCVQ